MFCPKCGTKAEPFSKFCVKCGQPLDTTGTAASAQTQPPRTAPAGVQTPGTPRPHGKPSAVLLYFRSNVVLASAILFSVYTLLGLFSNTTGSLFGILNNLLRALDLDSIFSFLLSSAVGEVYNTFMILLNIFTHLFDIIISAGLWLTWITARKAAKRQQIKPHGLTAFRVIIVLQIISGLLTPFIVFIGGFMLIEWLEETALVMILAAVVWAVVHCLCYKAFYRSVGVIRNAVTAEKVSDDRTSGFIGFILILYGVFNAVTNLTSFPILFKSVAFILFGVLFFKYNKLLQARAEAAARRQAQASGTEQKYNSIAVPVNANPGHNHIPNPTSSDENKGSDTNTTP